MVVKKVVSALMLIGAVSSANADVCKANPGSVTCGKGEVESLKGNGMVSVNGTTVRGITTVNGMLSADDASFSSIDINGNVTLYKCSVNDEAEIKGSLKASSTIFEKSLDIYSNYIRVVDTKIKNNINVHHTNQPMQKIFLDNNSEVGGDIVFDDGNGTVFVSKGSKIVGTVIGGKVINK